MYKIIIGFYLLYSAKNNFTRLFSLENGINSFTAIDWILLVLSVLMIPLAFLMFYAGYKSIKEKKAQEETAHEEQMKEEIKRKEEMFSELEISSAEPLNDEKTDEFTSRYDS